MTSLVTAMGAQNMINKYLLLSGLACTSFYCQESFANDDLQNEIPYPFYQVQKSADGQQNKLTALNSGIASLQARIDIIRKAKKNIEVEYFIYALDQSSKLFTVELVKAAKRGVKVRILVDKSVTIFELDEYYAKALREKGIEVKYYNTAATIRLSSMNFRNHRKLLSVDDKYAITGGRNIEDDYFDLSPKYNFLDRDVLIEGPMARTLRDSFDQYFENRISEAPQFPTRPADFIRKRKSTANGKSTVTRKVSNKRNVDEYLERTKKAQDFLVDDNSNQKLLEKVASIGKPILYNSKSHICPELTYATDRPGGTFLKRLVDDYSDDYRYLRKVFNKKVSSTNKHLYLSSPYILNNRRSRKLMKDLLDRKVEITMYTNSLASTDAVYVAANLYKDVFRWARMGMNTHVHSSLYHDEATTKLDDSVKEARWGTHSKTQIYESLNSMGELETEIMVGTYNIDNRSNHYNSEMGVFCKGSEGYSKDVKDNMLDRLKHSYQIHGNRTATNSSGDRVAVLGKNPDGKFTTVLVALPAWLLKFLL